MLSKLTKKKINKLDKNNGSECNSLSEPSERESFIMELITGSIDLKDLFVKKAMEPAFPKVSSGESPIFTHMNAMLGPIRSVAKHLHSDDQDVKMSLECIEVLLSIFALYGFSFSLEDAERDRVVVREAIGRAAYASDQCGWIKYFKYKIAAFFAAWHDQDLPPCPFIPHPEAPENPRVLFGGRFYSFIQRKLRFDKLFESFTVSILQSKKGMPRPSDSAVNKAVRDHIEVMTTVPPSEEEVTIFFERPSVIDCLPGFPEVKLEPQDHITIDSSQYTVTKNKVAHEIERTMREYTKGFKISLDDLSKPYLPSVNSCGSDSRKEGGSFNALLHTASFARFETAKGASIWARELREMQLRGFISEYYGFEGYYDTCTHSEDRSVLVPCLDTSETIRLHRGFYWDLVSEARAERPAVKVIGLKEALKIRTISKGPPITYHVLRPFQKMMWKHMQQFRVFELTGKPISSFEFNDRFKLFLNHRFHSGDYSQATDLIYSWCTELAAKVFLDEVSKINGWNTDVFRPLFEKALTQHTYSGERQVRGQLMGSIISFPFLCLLNFALMRMTLEETEGQHYSMREYPGWINGDDCLTPYQGQHFGAIWEANAAIFGFKKSVGKTYDSDKLCSMNSMTFSKGPTGWKEVPYVNMGLMNRMGRSIEEDKDAQALMTLGVQHKDLLTSCPPSLRQTCNQMFIWKHLEELKQYPGPWFAPHWMGGLGLHHSSQFEDGEILHAAKAMKLESKEPFKIPKEQPRMFDLYNTAIQQTAPFIGTYNYEEMEDCNDDSELMACVIWDYVRSNRQVSAFRPDCRSDRLNSIRLHEADSNESKSLARLKARFNEVKAVDVKFVKKERRSACAAAYFHEKKASITPVASY